MQIRAAVALAALLSLPGAARAASVWTALATEKIRPRRGASRRRDRSHRRGPKRVRGIPGRRHRPGDERPGDARARSTGRARIEDVRLYRAALIDVQHAVRARRRDRPLARRARARRRRGRGRAAQRLPVRRPRGREPRHLGRGLRPARRAGRASTRGDVARQLGRRARRTVPVALTRLALRRCPSTASLEDRTSASPGARSASATASTADAFADAARALRRSSRSTTASRSRTIDDGSAATSTTSTAYFGPLARRRRAHDPARGRAAHDARVPRQPDAPTHALGVALRARRAGSTGSSSTPATSRRSPAAGRDIPAPRAARPRGDPDVPDARDDDASRTPTRTGVADSIDIIVPVVNYMDDTPGSGTRATSARSTTRSSPPSQQQRGLAVPELHEPRLRRTVNIGSPSDRIATSPAGRAT